MMLFKALKSLLFMKICVINTSKLKYLTFFIKLFFFNFKKCSSTLVNKTQKFKYFFSFFHSFPFLSPFSSTSFFPFETKHIMSNNLLQAYYGCLLTYNNLKPYEHCVESNHHMNNQFEACFFSLHPID